MGKSISRRTIIIWSLTLIGFLLLVSTTYSYFSEYFTTVRWQAEAKAAYPLAQGPDYWWNWNPWEVAYYCWSTVSNWAQTVSAMLSVVGAVVTLLKRVNAKEERV